MMAAPSETYMPQPYPIRYGLNIGYSSLIAMITAKTIHMVPIMNNRSVRPRATLYPASQTPDMIIPKCQFFIDRPRFLGASDGLDGRST